jgi:hypothetical protein
MANAQSLAARYAVLCVAATAVCAHASYDASSVSMIGGASLGLRFDDFHFAIDPLLRHHEAFFAISIVNPLL